MVSDSNKFVLIILEAGKKYSRLLRTVKAEGVLGSS